MTLTARQIADVLVKKIRTSEYQEGDRLPSGPDLQVQYGVARMTASSALDHVVSDGYAEARNGSGTYVTRYDKTGNRQTVVRDWAELTPGGISLRFWDDGSVDMRHGQITLVYTADEWEAFVKGARDGEFDFERLSAGQG